MAPSSKRRVDIRIPPGQQKKVSEALETLASLYAPLAAEWVGLDEERKRRVLENSPLLAKLLGVARPFLEGERWP